MRTAVICLPLQLQTATECYWKAKNPASITAGKFPCLIVSEGDEEFYGIPDIDFPGHIKVGVTLLIIVLKIKSVFQKSLIIVWCESSIDDRTTIFERSA